MFKIINYRFILHTLGNVMLFEGIFMLLSIFVSFIYHEDCIAALTESSLITIFTGISLIVFTKEAKNEEASKKDSFLSASLSWIVISLFGALPFLLTHSVDNFTNALFESVSGFTTTGSSVINDVESLSHGVLFWRAETHWIGGMGIIVLVIAILPYYRIGASHLFSAEGSMMGVEKLKPKVIDTAKRLWAIYMLFTVSETILLMAGGMGWFDSVCHSFATIATGGFSTNNDSLMSSTPYIQYVVIIFMFLSGANFSLHYFVLNRNFNKVFSNEEFKTYTGIILIVALIISIGNSHFYNSTGSSVRHSLFQVVSIITATGFSSDDYTLWPKISIQLIFLLMFVGASVGSTGGGIKIARHLIVIKAIMYQFKCLVNPNAINVVRYNNAVVETSTITSVLAFILLYGLTFLTGSLFMAAIGTDPRTACSSVITTLGGIGPGLGDVGPASTFFSLPVAGKLYLCINMIAGRLEIIPFFIIFSRNFYKA